MIGLASFISSSETHILMRQDFCLVTEDKSRGRAAGPGDIRLNYCGFGPDEKPELRHEGCIEVYVKQLNIYRLGMEIGRRDASSMTKGMADNKESERKQSAEHGAPVQIPKEHAHKRR